MPPGWCSFPTSRRSNPQTLPATSACPCRPGYPCTATPSPPRRETPTHNGGSPPQFGGEKKSKNFWKLHNKQGGWARQNQGILDKNEGWRIIFRWGSWCCCSVTYAIFVHEVWSPPTDFVCISSRRARRSSSSFFAHVVPLFVFLLLVVGRHLGQPEYVSSLLTLSLQLLFRVRGLSLNVMRPIHVLLKRLLHLLLFLESIHRSWELCAMSSTTDTCHCGFDFDLQSLFVRPPCLSVMPFSRTAFFSNLGRKCPPFGGHRGRQGKAVHWLWVKTRHCLCQTPANIISHQNLN